MLVNVPLALHCITSFLHSITVGTLITLSAHCCKPFSDYGFSWNFPKTVPILLFSGREKQPFILRKDRAILKCPCDQKINSHFSLDFKTMLTKH